MVTVTLKELRARARGYADMEKDEGDDAFVSDELLDGHIKDALQELLSISADAYGEALSIQTTVLTVVDQELYPRPSDCFRVTSFEYDNLPMDRYNSTSIEELKISGEQDPHWNEEFLGVRIYPPFKIDNIPLRLWYIQKFPDLTDEDQLLTMVDHGDTFVAARAAMPLKDKEEADYSFVRGKASEAEGRIQLEGWARRPRKLVRRRRTARGRRG
jgi:hypothetical protein